MKIVYFTDTHILGRNPGSRIDNYPEALHRKMLEIENVCRAEKPNALVMGGDLFDSPRIADSIKNRYIRIFRRIRSKFKVPIYVVPGNHDLFGYSMDTIDQTALGILASSGVVTLITRDKSHRLNGISLTDDDGVIVAIHGQEYHKDIDKDARSDYDIQINRKADWNILFSHGMLLEKPFHPDVTYTLTKDVVTDADMVVNGHYHPGYDVHEINDTIFANPGSTGRDEICKRQPQYAIITATDDDLDIEYFEYQTAEDHNDIFDHTVKAQVQAHQRYLEAFEQTIEDAMTFDSFDPKDVLIQLAQAQAITQEIQDQAFDAITEAESTEKVNKLEGYTEKQSALSISKIHIQNFQSHKDTVIELNERGLNALTGASDSGKSAIVRAIRWVLYNDPKGTDFIRHGESRTTVSVTFNDGSSLTRSRTNSSAGEYIVRDAQGNEKEFKGFGNDLPIDIANTHQMPRVELSTGIERSLNFSYQLDGHFLLSDSPAIRAATIGRLTGVHIVDAAIKEKSKDIRNATRDINTAEKRIEDLNAKLELFTDLKGMEEQINLSSALMISAESYEKEIEELQELYQTSIDTYADIKNLTQELQSYDGLDTAEKLIQEADLRMSEIQELSQKRLTWRGAVKDVKNLTAELESYKDLSKAEGKLDTAVTLYDEINELDRMLSAYDESNDEVARLNKAYLQYENLDQLELLIARAESLMQEVSDLEEAFDEIDTEDKMVNQYELLLNQQFDTQVAMQEQIVDLMKEMGNKCPTCHQSIDDAHIAHMLE